ncbi:MAG: T9SS type A sorting domain-containing protein [Bacteroidetes bacterium]|nr:T9SS type A sorting domain-containing protein [Bacteroidota bacterium]
MSYVYTDADISGTEVNMETAKWDGSDWWIYQSVNAGTNTLFSTMGITTIPAGHNFTGGSPGALPIELTSFEATALIDKVQVIWSTASEINNEYFQLERSKNGTGFDIINRVAGAGNSFTETEYSYIDLNPHKGTSYYRLLQVDFNGDSKMYGPISVEIENNTDPGLYLFPNPSNGATLNLQLSNIDASEEPIEVRIFDQLGKKVYTYKIDTEFETIISMICFEETLSAGIYSVIATSPGMTLTQKLIVQ